MNSFSAEKSIFIEAPAAKVWDALTNPKLIKQYFFGVDVISDWKVGNPILYKGSWEGKSFEDKGTILEMDPEKRMVCDYWSSFSGLPDTPENRQKITYTLTPKEKGSQLQILQENIPTEKAREDSEKNWGIVLEAMKKLLENE